MSYPSFNVGEVLTAADMNAVGLWKIANATFTGITSAAPLDVNGVFSSNYSNYLLLLRSSQTVANGSLIIRMRTVSAQEAGAVYNYGFGGAYVGAGPVYNFGGFAQTNPFGPDTGFFGGITPGNGYSGNSRFDIYSPNEARATRFAGQGYTDYTGTWYNASLLGNGEVATNTQYTGFRLFPNAGTAAGEYTVYGYRK
jgi:hypothetical protein